MKTIVIATDKQKEDKHLVNNLKRLFPECKIEITYKNRIDECRDPGYLKYGMKIESLKSSE